MTSRRALVLYHLLAAASVVGTLMAVNPAPAALPLGFAVIYLGVLFLLYFLGWVVRVERWPHGRWALAALGCAVLWLSMTAINPGAGVIALLLAPVSLWPRTIG